MVPEDGDEDDETTEILLKFRDQIRNLLDTRNLCPPGDFSITFQLPGCLDDQQFNGDFTDGIFIGVVKKKVTRSIQLRQICLC
ncbi:hypothetical protein CISIN_1g045199mg [Citrus sinensis]|uniref:SHSP domain-containing protein n=1 Tax=Citrus sinensis TaxID=2711 RepID=A0A067F8I9_CITSI|nr:hypothetical protein CISIN_1g045199mg [Citrus sinensis]